MEETTARTIQSYNQTAALYAEGQYGFDMSRQQERFLQALPPGYREPLLDLGCGPGRDIRYFSRRGYRTIGMDLSSGLLEEARRRVKSAGLVRADMRSLPFAPACFAGIWACASFLHIPKNQAPWALAEMGRVLVPGGGLFLAVKHGFNESWTEKSEQDTRFFFAYYQPGELQERVVAAGFEVNAMVEETSTTKNSDGSPVRWINLYARKKAV
ncbi:MAG TPA: class I SAM-dependent methyltransferase [Chloroflexia bacterium]|nr:class I SAM-dependent methyltransferase [Chloroflexia bacterium]